MATEIEELSVSVAASITGAVDIEPDAITESIDVVEGMPAGAGRRGGEGGGVDGAGEEGRKWGAPRAPMILLNPLVTRPPLVVRVRETLPPIAQTKMNTVMEATRNCEFVLDDMKSLSRCLLTTRLPCECQTSWYLHKQEVHHENC